MGRNKKEESAPLAEISDGSKSLLGSLLNGYKDDHYNFINVEKKRISTGSLILDSFLKIKSGSTLRVGAASAEAGKSSQCILLAKNYMQTMPKSKTFFLNSEARLTEEFKARTGLTYVTKPEEWEYGTIFVLNSNVMESACRMIEALLKSMYENGEHLCIIIDSIDMLTLKVTTTEKEFGDFTKTAGVQFLTKELFRRIGHKINAYNALMLVTSQYSSAISIDPYGPKEPPKLMQGSSANALNHQSDYALYYRARYQGDLILEKPDDKPDPVKNKTLGVYATIEIKKSATDKTGTVLKIPISRKIKNGSQIWVSKEVSDMILAWGLAKKAGAWITFEPSVIEEAKTQSIELKEKVNGLNALYDYLDENDQVCNWFYGKFKDVEQAED